MSAKLPVVSGRKTVRALKKVGFVEQPGRGKGSHVVMYRAESNTLLTIPDHRELRRGLLRALLRHAGLGVEDFIKLL